MDNQKLGGLLMILGAQVLNLITERRNADYKDAVKLFYSSTLYSKLEQEETKLWHLSAETLYSLLDEELTTGKITFPEEQS